jgi:hypothetical protein
MVVAVMSSVVATTACSAIVLRPLDAGLAARRDEPICPLWAVPPVLDLGLGAYSFFVAFLGLVFDAPLLAMGGTAVGATFTGSSVYGFRATSRCARHGDPPEARRLERDDARDIVDDALPAFVACGSIATPVRVAVAVNPAGRVVRTHVYPPADPAVAACVAAAVERIAFPVSASGLIFSHELSW